MSTDSHPWGDDEPPIIRALRRHRVDVVLVSRSDFEEGKAIRGTLAELTVREGRRLAV